MKDPIPIATMIRVRIPKIIGVVKKSETALLRITDIIKKTNECKIVVIIRKRKDRN